eukprot:Plantae.Rhodophyta-Hildenbrandia_rubra.ctg7016.p1 GENE.Plantae.Rhodophyta-Hildenbrandia_rubra.ctg7016~~Plantae.Rhodophyta-Hildenbrandia_rubra.ctg7016.p1  ORF type:complete len:1342 (-),score=247.02 Plantae.Rhodophyta-Hildenbrandia_rubra.ctg7016:1979-6004(-)
METVVKEIECREPIFKTSNGEIVRTGQPNMRHYSDGRRVHRYTSLSQNLRLKKYPEVTVSARNLSLFVGHLQMFMEKHLGRYAKDKDSIGITRIPAWVFRDLVPGGTLEKVVTWTLEFGAEKACWDILPGFGEEDMVGIYLEFVRWLDEKLQEDGVVKVPRVYFGEGFEEEEVEVLRDCVLSHGGIVVKVVEVASHVVYPDIEERRNDGDGGSEKRDEAPLCRILAIEPRAGTNVARIHWWYCPSSYDSKVAINDVCGDVDPYGQHPTVWHVQARFLRDTHLYNEWMVEEDYEIPENHPQKMDVRSNFIGGVSQDSSNDADSPGRGGKVQKLVLRLFGVGKPKRKNESVCKRDSNGRIIVPLPDIPLSSASDTDSEQNDKEPVEMTKNSSALPVRRRIFVESEEEDEDDSEESKAVNDDDYCPQEDERDIRVTENKVTEEISNEGPLTDDQMMPSYSDWFSMEDIHQIEMRSLPEFFCSRYESKTPNVYKDARNFMIETFRKTPKRYISATAVRRSLHGDAPAVVRIHTFLHHWGLINWKVDPKTRPSSPFLPCPLPAPSHKCSLFLDNGSSAEIESYGYQAAVQQGPVFRRRRNEKVVTEGYTDDNRHVFEANAVLQSLEQTVQFTHDGVDPQLNGMLNGTQSGPGPLSSTRARRRATRVRHNYNEDVADTDGEDSMGESEGAGMRGQHRSSQRNDEVLAKVNYSRWYARLRQRIVAVGSALNETRSGGISSKVQKAKAIQYHCNSCDIDCSAARYHASTRPDIDVCGKCYAQRIFPTDMAPSDFIQMSSPPASFFTGGKRGVKLEASSPVKKRRKRRKRRRPRRILRKEESDDDSNSHSESDSVEQEGLPDGIWTESETLLLLEALEMYGDYWEKVSEHVGSKAPLECVEQFLKLPIEDPYLSHGGQKWWGGDDLGVFHAILDPRGCKDAGFELDSDQVNLAEELLGERLATGKDWTGKPAVMADRGDPIGVNVSVLATLIGDGTTLRLAPDYASPDSRLMKNAGRPQNELPWTGKGKYKKSVAAIPSIKQMIREEWGVEASSAFLGGGKTVIDGNTVTDGNMDTIARVTETDGKVSQNLDTSEEEIRANESEDVEQPNQKPNREEENEKAIHLSLTPGKRSMLETSIPTQKRLRTEEPNIEEQSKAPSPENNPFPEDSDFESLPPSDAEDDPESNFVPAEEEDAESGKADESSQEGDLGPTINETLDSETPIIESESTSIPEFIGRRSVDKKSSEAVACLIMAAARNRAKELALIEEEEVQRLRSIVVETALRMGHMKVERLKLLTEHELKSRRLRDADDHVKFVDTWVAKTMHSIAPHMLAERGTMVARNTDRSNQQ